MGVTWTPLFSSFSAPDVGWQPYDILTNKGVPANAVALIMITNVTTNSERDGGVRAYGSSLNRFLPIHESEGGGENGYLNWVQVNGSGYIEVYADNIGSIVFRVMGYLTGTVFTEKFSAYQNYGTYPNGTWGDHDLDAGDSVPGSRVCVFTHRQHGQDWYCDMGVRTNGSSLVRIKRLHECEPGEWDNVNWTQHVKCDANSIVEIYMQYVYYNDIDSPYQTFLMGYFDSEMDYQELWSAKDITSTATWQQFDLTSDLDEDGRLVDIAVFNTATGATNTLGARGGDESVDKYYEEHECESYGISGMTFVCKSDADGVIDLYAATPGSEETHLMGYFIYTPEAATKEITKYSDARIFDVQEFTKLSDARVYEVQEFNKLSDARVKAEQEFMKNSDTRVKAEQEFNKNSDSRVYHEHQFTKTSDAQVYVGAKQFTKTSDARIKAEGQEFQKTSDSRVKKTQYLKYKYWA